MFEGSPGAGGYAYVATLPTPDVPALWPPEALAALSGTRTHSAAASRRAFVTAVHTSLFGDGGGGIPYERFSWALSQILSRALSGPGAPYGLVPVLDALNHSVEPSCACVALARCARRCVPRAQLLVARRHGFDGGAGEFVVTALRPHAPGEQLYISYGSHLCNDRLLRLYGAAAARRTVLAGGNSWQTLAPGFTTDGNPHDAALLPPPWPARRPDDPLTALKARTLQRADVAPVPHVSTGEPPSHPAMGSPPAAGRTWWSEDVDAAPLPVRGSADAGALLAMLRVMHATEEDLSSGDAAAGPRTVLDGTRPLSARNEAAARESLHAAARAALARYPSTLEQTEVALPDHGTRARDAAAARLVAALRVRAGEQRALTALLHAS